MSLRSAGRAGAVGLLAALALPTATSITQGSAARLIITDPGVVQYWEFPFSYTPPAPTPPVPPAACGALDDYADVLYAEAGKELVAPSPNGEKGKGYILIGTDGPDRITGSQQDDCLVGLEGDDVLLGGNGKDILLGGAGTDVLDGGNGPDAMDGGGQAGDVCISEGSPDGQPVGCSVESSEKGVGKSLGATAGSAADESPQPEQPDAEDQEDQ